MFISFRKINCASSYGLLWLLMLQSFVFLPTGSGQALTNWGLWSDCSKSCEGEQTRTRECTGTCNESLSETRRCNTHKCITDEMILILVSIGAAGLLLVIIIILVCFKLKRDLDGELSKAEVKEEEREEGNFQDLYDSVSTSRSRSLRHFPSVSSSPEPQKEPEIAMDSIEFDAESLNESIHEVSVVFGVDEEYEPKTSVTSHKDTQGNLARAEDESQAEPIYQKPNKAPKRPADGVIVIKPL